jgi:hypothetical protein
MNRIGLKTKKEKLSPFYLFPLLWQRKKKQPPKQHLPATAQVHLSRRGPSGTNLLPFFIFRA